MALLVSYCCRPKTQKLELTKIDLPDRSRTGDLGMALVRALLLQSLALPTELQGDVGFLSMPICQYKYLCVLKSTIL